MYMTAVGRAQPKVQLPWSLFLLRADSKMIDEVMIPSYRTVERTLSTANYSRIFSQIGPDTIFYIIDRTKCAGLLEQKAITR